MEEGASLERKLFVKTLVKKKKKRKPARVRTQRLLREVHKRKEESERMVY